MSGGEGYRVVHVRLEGEVEESSEERSDSHVATTDAQADVG